MSLLEGPIASLENWMNQEDLPGLIVRLGRESREDGDTATAKLCARALNGDEKAWKKCCEILSGKGGS